MAISKFNYNSFNVTPVAGNALSFNSDADGFTTKGASAMVLIKTVTASSSSTVTFVNGTSDVVLDSTYPIYRFVFTNCHPSANGPYFQVNFRDGSTAYDATKTSTFFAARHSEDDSAAALAYNASNDLAQGTGDQFIDGFGINNDNDSSISGELFLFNPSSTTFVKHFIVNTSGHFPASHNFTAGYCNTTTAIDGVEFSFQSGNIDAGTIKLYGIADS